MEQGNFIEVESLVKSAIKTKDPHNQLVQKPKTNLGWTLGKNPFVKKIVRPVYEFAKLMTEINSKMREFKTYNKSINNLIHRNK